MNTTSDGAGLRRVTGWLFVVGAAAFAAAATVLSSTFEWPDILRESPEVVLPAFVAGGTSLVWTWFAVAWTYAILLVPVWDLGGLLGSTLWGVWVIALGVAVLRAPIRRPTAAAVPAPSHPRS